MEKKMEKRIAGFTYAEVKEHLLWVVKFVYGGREVGTYAEIERYLKGDDVRDLDIVCKDGQPTIMHPFMDEVERINREHGWMPFPDMFEKYGA